MDRKRTYIRNAIDIGPQCTSSATEEADVYRAEMSNDYVDRTMSNFAYLISSWWAGRHVVVICGRDEIPLAVLASVLLGSSQPYCTRCISDVLCIMHHARVTGARLFVTFCATLSQRAKTQHDRVLPSFSLSTLPIIDMDQSQVPRIALLPYPLTRHFRLVSRPHFPYRVSNVSSVGGSSF